MPFCRENRLQVEFLGQFPERGETPPSDGTVITDCDTYMCAMKMSLFMLYSIKLVRLFYICNMKKNISFILQILKNILNVRNTYRLGIV